MEAWDRKRKTSGADVGQEPDYDPLALSLSSTPRPTRPRLEPAPPPQEEQEQEPPPLLDHGRRAGRRNPRQAPHEANVPDRIDPPFSWATDRPCTTYSLPDLLSRGITNVNGKVQCRRCEARDMISYDLYAKFVEVALFIERRKDDMHHRAPPEWINPTFPPCKGCRQANCMRPVLPEKKEEINWLFMLLGQTLGCCSLDQLKYFCRHTGQHRTGAKDRVLYLAYLALCKNLDPAGPFDP